MAVWFLQLEQILRGGSREQSGRKPPPFRMWRVVKLGRRYVQHRIS